MVKNDVAKMFLPGAAGFEMKSLPWLRNQYRVFNAQALPKTWIVQQDWELLHSTHINS